MSMNQHHIKTLEIQNFKSIKQLQFDCNRINLFVGKPNVGKSNILEAVSLFAVEDLHSESKDELKVILSSLVRNNSYKDFFYDQDISNKIKVCNNNLTIEFEYSGYSFDFIFYHSDLSSDYLENFFSRSPHLLEEVEFSTDSKGVVKFINSEKDSFTNEYKSNCNIRPYFFSNKERNLNGKSAKASLKCILPKEIFQIPNGGNFVTLMQTNKVLRETVTKYFEPYNLELLIDASNNTVEIQKRIDGLVYKIPFTLIADTLQRMIFYMAAILSNENATLIFEEPEAHAYPPFIKQFSEKVLESTSNQFFIATHNPYILNTLLENDTDDEVNLFLVDYKDHQTTIKLIDGAERNEMLAHGIDIFFNERWFQQL